jgi:hypothetical protein
MNQQYTKEEYEARKEEFLTKTETEKKRMKGVCFMESMHRAVHLTGSEDATGDYLTRCKHCSDAFNAMECQDCVRVWDAVQSVDCMDGNELGYCELCYELIEAFPESRMVHFSFFTAHTHDMLYCDHCYNSSNLFGCVGIKRKQYCILNKQYSKEEYDTLASQIIAHMSKTKEWGEFFPMELSPFGYNETVANDYFPIDESTAQASGLQWHTEAEVHQQYLGASASIPQSIHDVSDDVCQKILQCAETGKLYKIIPQELKFYRDMKLPIHGSSERLAVAY